MKNPFQHIKNQQGGLFVVELIILAVVVAVAGFVGFKTLLAKPKPKAVVTHPHPATSPPPTAPTPTPNPNPSHGPTPTPTSTPTPVPQGGVLVTDADNGKTITLGKLQSLTVQLSSTYWHINESSDTSIIHMAGDPVYHSSGTGVPGSGDGTVTATFSPGAPGSATISASRTTCGEALACTGSQGKFQITVITPALK